MKTAYTLCDKYISTHLIVVAIYFDDFSSFSRPIGWENESGWDWQNMIVMWSEIALLIALLERSNLRSTSRY
jgi:hypothetical protein